MEVWLAFLHPHWIHLILTKIKACTLFKVYSYPINMTLTSIVDGHLRSNSAKLSWNQTSCITGQKIELNSLIFFFEGGAPKEHYYEVFIILPRCFQRCQLQIFCMLEMGKRRWCLKFLIVGNTPWIQGHHKSSHWALCKKQQHFPMQKVRCL